MVGVRDRDAAAGILAKWRGYVAQEFGAEFAEGYYRGIDTWVDEDAQQAYALTNDWLVYATDASTLQATLISRRRGRRCRSAFFPPGSNLHYTVVLWPWANGDPRIRADE